MFIHNLGDTLVATERIWSKDLGRIILPGTVITIHNLDDAITLPSPSKWLKQNDKKIYNRGSMYSNS